MSKYNPEYFKNKRETRLSSNLCCNCGIVPPSPGKTCCANCLEKKTHYKKPKRNNQQLIQDSINSKAKRAEREANGLCNRCGKELHLPGKKACHTCLSTISAKQKGFSTAGLCKYCGVNLPIKGRNVCESCYEKQHAIYAKQREENRHRHYLRKQKGNCVYCGEKIPADAYNDRPRASCDSCREKRRQKAAEKRHYKFPHILKRDDYQCQICKSSQRLCIHHIDGHGVTHNGDLLPLEEQNNSDSNLITLCTLCHVAITRLRIVPSDRKLAVLLIES